MKGRRFVLIAGIVSILILPGCTSYDLHKTFVREKKDKEPEPAQFEIAAEQREYTDLYKEHFNLWTVWARDLIESSAENPKGVRSDLKEARRHLEYLQRYLQPEQADIVKKHLLRFDEITGSLFAFDFTSQDYGRFRKKLRALDTEVRASLAFPEVSAFILPTPLSFDMDAYSDEEPELDDLKDEIAEADTSKDEDAEITYEEYRKLPVE